MEKKNIAVIFGSRSAEHEISIITAHQIMDALDRSQYNVFPIYITKQGKWLYKRKFLQIETFRYLRDPVFWFGRNSVTLNECLEVVTLNFGIWKQRIKIDVAIPATHGTFGEDGTVPAYLELLNVPYVGSNVLASAICMHKGISKRVFRDVGLPIVEFLEFDKTQYMASAQNVLETIENKFSYPAFVKPANLGSSIGVSKVKNREALEDALDLAFSYGREVLVEHCVENLIELNCSVIGNETLRASALERPIFTNQDFLNFDAKYVQGNKKLSGMARMSRELPAQVPEDVTHRVQDLAKKAYKACKCSGIARIDFLMDQKSNEIFVNEINTLPGAFSYYLWECSGLPFPKLLDDLIEFALEQHKKKQDTIFSLKDNLLAKSLSPVKLAGSKASLPKTQ